MPTIHISPGFLFQGKSALPSHHLSITYHLYSYKAGMSNMFRFTPNRQCEKKGFRVHACYVDFFFTFHHLVLIHVSGQYSSKGFPHAPFLSPQPIYILIWSTNTFWFDQQIYFDLIIKFILIWSSNTLWFVHQIHFDLTNKCILIWSTNIFRFDQQIHFDLINKHVLSFGRAAYKKALPTCTPFCHLNTFLPSSNVKRGPSSLQWWRPFQYYIYQDPTKKIYAVYFAGDKDRDISRHIL